MAITDIQDSGNVTTFKVSKDIKLEPTSNYKIIQLEQRLKNNKDFQDVQFESSSIANLIEPSSIPRGLSLNGFAEAVHIAYDKHHGLTLEPDHLFIVILQGLSIHIGQDGEKYREILGLGHLEPGKKEKIDIRRDEFILGSKDNDWQQLFPEFVDIIGTKIGNDIFPILTGKFSSSTNLSLAIRSLTIMDVFKSYFEYSVSTRCGIPEISLKGTHQDWVDLKSRVEELLNKFDDLKFWTEHLYPVLDEFVSATSDSPTRNSEFWSSLYKPVGGSGGPFISGWINTLYPYIQDSDSFHQNEYMNWAESNSFFSGLKYNQIPVGFTKTPFVWNYYDKKFEMSFVGGFLGTEKIEDKDHIAPVLGWSIIHNKKQS